MSYETQLGEGLVRRKNKEKVVGQRERGLERIELDARINKVAFIANPGSSMERDYIFHQKGEDVVNWQKAKIMDPDGKGGQIPLWVVRATAEELTNPKDQIGHFDLLHKAVKTAYDSGARIILFGASTKFTNTMLEEKDLKKDFPDCEFMDGNPETVETIWEQLKNFLDLKEKLLFLGAGSHIGTYYYQKLKKSSYNLKNVIPCGQQMPDVLKKKRYPEVEHAFQTVGSFDLSQVPPDILPIKQVLNCVHLGLLTAEQFRALGVEKIFEIARPTKYEDVVKELASIQHFQLGTWKHPDLKWEIAPTDLGQGGMYACFVSAVVKAMFGAQATPEKFVAQARQLGFKLQYVDE